MRIRGRKTSGERGYRYPFSRVAIPLGGRSARRHQASKRRHRLRPRSCQSSYCNERPAWFGEAKRTLVCRRFSPTAYVCRLPAVSAQQSAFSRYGHRSPTEPAVSQSPCGERFVAGGERTQASTAVLASGRPASVPLCRSSAHRSRSTDLQ